MDDNEPGFEKIYTDFQPKILRYLAHLVGEHEAEDLTQETFVKVNRALGDFRGESKLSTWLYRVATNTALDKLRSPSFRQSASPDLIEIDETPIDDRNTWTGEKTPLIEQQIYRKEMNDCIAGYIERLPENYRMVLVLSEMEGLSNNEIAEILGVSLDTVKIRLHRGKAKLKQELESQCDSYWVEGNEFLPDLKRIPGKSKETN